MVHKEDEQEMLTYGITRVVTNMEPDGMDSWGDDVPLQPSGFQVPCQFSRV